MRRRCPGCGEDTLFVSEAVYDGFRRTGEIHRCTACGHELRESGTAAGAVKKPAAKANPLWDLFAAGEGEESPSLFDVEAETAALCRKCRHYVVHPFTQRCMLHDKEVAATDSCAQFTPRADGTGASGR